MKPRRILTGRFKECAALLGALALALVLAPAAHAGVTECDRMASHPSDPDKVLPGVHRPEIDLPRAEAACRAAVADDPRSARALYHLGRVLFYEKKTDEALQVLERSAGLGYRQSIFVLGFVLYEGTQAPRNDCRAAGLWQRSVGLDHPWTGAYLVEAYLDGRFASCGLKLGDADIERYYRLASTHISVDESEGRVERLGERLVARRKAAASSAASTAAGAVVPFDPKKYSQQVTECDRLASHPEDPYRVAPGREKPGIDLPRAIEACRAAVLADPKNPRLNYLLGRVYGYSERGAEGIPYRQVAVDADYPQALFVIGYITLFGMNQQPQDTCRGAELIRRSALQDRLAGQLGFPRYVLAGMFDQCSVPKETQEMLGFIAAARRQIHGDYYQTLLADQLEAELKKRP